MEYHGTIASNLPSYALPGNSFRSTHRMGLLTVLYSTRYCATADWRLPDSEKGPFNLSPRGEYDLILLITRSLGGRGPFERAVERRGGSTASLSESGNSDKQARGCITQAQQPGVDLAGRASEGMTTGQAGGSVCALKLSIAVHTTVL
jgi:hypothetical protein